jgi:predicted DNA-binding protein
MVKRRPKSRQISIRVDLDSLDKLDRFVGVTGGTRGTLIRQLIDEFAGKADALVELLESARKGAERDVVIDWVREIMDSLEGDVSQLSMPVWSGPKCSIG